MDFQASPDISEQKWRDGYHEREKKWKIAVLSLTIVCAVSGCAREKSEKPFSNNRGGDEECPDEFMAAIRPFISEMPIRTGLMNVIPIRIFWQAPGMWRRRLCGSYMNRILLPILIRTHPRKLLKYLREVRLRGKPRAGGDLRNRIIRLSEQVLAGLKAALDQIGNGRHPQILGKCMR